jgi:hypothetical protein
MIDDPADFVLNEIVYHIHQDDNLFDFPPSHSDSSISSRLKMRSQSAQVPGSATHSGCT